MPDKCPANKEPRCFEPCINPCRGLFCCNCCADAPAMHFADSLWQRYDPDCCRRERCINPERCMFKQGRPRSEWENDPNI